MQNQREIIIDILAEHGASMTTGQILEMIPVEPNKFQPSSKSVGKNLQELTEEGRVGHTIAGNDTDVWTLTPTTPAVENPELPELPAAPDKVMPRISELAIRQAGDEAWFFHLSLLDHIMELGKAWPQIIPPVLSKQPMTGSLHEKAMWIHETLLILRGTYHEFISALQAWLGAFQADRFAVNWGAVNPSFIDTAIAALYHPLSTMPELPSHADSVSVCDVDALRESLDRMQALQAWVDKNFFAPEKVVQHLGEMKPFFSAVREQIEDNKAPRMFGSRRMPMYIVCAWNGYRIPGHELGFK